MVVNIVQKATEGSTAPLEDLYRFFHPPNIWCIPKGSANRDPFCFKLLPLSRGLGTFIKNYIKEKNFRYKCCLHYNVITTVYTGDN